MQQLMIDFSEPSSDIESQTGWQRPHPKTLLQDIELLLRVERFDYNLKDPEFVRYAHRRGCMNGAGVPGESDPDRADYQLRMRQLAATYGTEEGKPFDGDIGQYRKWVREPWRRLEEFLSSKDLRTTESGSAIPAEERRTLWKYICIARGQLQDCWEVYQG